MASTPTTTQPLTDDDCAANCCGHVDTDAGPSWADHGHMTPHDWEAIESALQHAWGHRASRPGDRICRVCYDAHDEILSEIDRWAS